MQNWRSSGVSGHGVPPGVLEAIAEAMEGALGMFNSVMEQREGITLRNQQVIDI